MSAKGVGDVAWVTGATSGFGEAVARRLVAEGLRVVACGRRKDRLQKLRAELGDAVLPRVLDVTDRAAVDAAVAGLPDGFSEVDVVVNSAGLALGTGRAQDADADDWETMVATNISGVLHCTHALLPGMVRRNRGHVINMGSIAATFPYPGGNVYGATKAFLHQFGLNLRADLLGTAVRVSTIEPGMAETEFSAVRYKGDQEKARAVYAGMQPLTAEDIADATWWCLSRPAHVNINSVEIMPVAQAFAPFAVNRRSGD